jgi:membrane protein YdbS with pleckstrin-like domain
MNALHSRIRLRWGLLTLVGLAILGGAVTALNQYVFRVFPWLGVGAVILLAPISVLYIQLLYRSWRYELQTDALELERGVLTRVETAVPFVRVQHVDTQRNPLDRVLGLGSVVVYTAGSRGADVTIPGLTPEEARDLRNQLRDLAIESEPEDAV